jgi:hypothetical protein
MPLDGDRCSGPLTPQEVARIAKGFARQKLEDIRGIMAFWSTLTMPTYPFSRP